MTVQNYIGQFQTGGIDTSEVDVMISDRVEEVLMDIFSEGESGQGVSGEVFYTKSQIDTKLNDYLTKSGASSTYASKTSLNDYLTKTLADSTYATESDVVEAIQAIEENVQNNYYTKTQT